MAPTWQSLTCEDPAILTVPAVEGLQYTVNGEPVEAGDHEITEPGLVVVAAQASDGYSIPEGQTVDWEFTVTVPDCDTVASGNGIGDNGDGNEPDAGIEPDADVLPDDASLPGDQTQPEDNLATADESATDLVLATTGAGHIGWLAVSGLFATGLGTAVLIRRRSSRFNVSSPQLFG